MCTYVPPQRADSAAEGEKARRQGGGDFFLNYSLSLSTLSLSISIITKLYLSHYYYSVLLLNYISISIITKLYISQYCY